MPTNISRFLTLKNNPALYKFFNALDTKFPTYNLGTNTPILNHHLQTESNFSGAPATLYLEKQPSEMLSFIRQLAQKKSDYRISKNKPDTPIEFFCYGYQDHSGDIVIKNIVFPAYNQIRETSDTINEVYERLYNHTPSKDLKIDSFANYFDYLRNTKFNDKDNVGRIPVALYGTTKPIVSYADHTENCPRFGEVAKSIVPGDVDFGDMMTGVLTVSPYTISQTKDGYVYHNGSLEAILTKYRINNKNGYSYPEYLTNITNCQTTNSKGKLCNCVISNSFEPFMEFPIITDENYKY